MGRLAILKVTLVYGNQDKVENVKRLYHTSWWSHGLFTWLTEFITMLLLIPTHSSHFIQKEHTQNTLLKACGTRRYIVETTYAKNNWLIVSNKLEQNEPLGLITDHDSTFLLTRYLQEFQPLGTAGGIYHFRDQIAMGDPEAFLVLNADIIGDYPLIDFVEFHRKHSGEHSILATEASTIIFLHLWLLNNTC